MYTQCPECRQEHTIDVDQLRESRAIMRCENCSVMFDALELLSEQSQNASAELEKILPWEAEAKTKQDNKIWAISNIVLLLVFIGQFFFFEGYTLTQHNNIRPWLTKICSALGCRLPDYRNLNDFSVIQGSLDKADNNSYIFHAAINNQSAFSQNHPKIKLKLSSLTGAIFAQRTFAIDEYHSSAGKLIGSNETVEISLTIQAPDTTIGGYSFELI